MSAKKREKHDDGDDISFEAEPEREVSGGFGTPDKKMKRLKDELEVCKKERREYLDGWQRLKADMINGKRDEHKRLANARTEAQERLASELLPVLDSFDMAFQGKRWESVDEVWRRGVEHINAQFLDVLNAHGIRAFCSIGEEFDPALHEAMDERKEPDAKPHTIVSVVRKGYKADEHVLRPARVIIASE
ncbi:MAG: nucleotide exchange factor GrpE [bacterium]|nr:nucleotide exchange factor GrpE [bacterium]